MRVPAWQPVAESIAVVALIAAGQVALFTTLPGAPDLQRAVLYRAGGLSNATLTEEPWRLLACTWLHGNLDHLVGNLVFLLLMSVLISRALGWDRFLLLYLGSGLAGSVVSALVEQPDLAVGASGAIFGLTGATVAYATYPRSVLHEVEVMSVREALFPIVGLQLIFSFAPGTSWGGHLGGFVFGALAAGTGLADLGLPARATGAELAPVRWSWVLFSTALVLGLSLWSPTATLALLILYVGGLVVSGRTGPDWRPELRPSVMLAALMALASNGAAVRVALDRGDPWDLAADAYSEELPGGLGVVPMPGVLRAARLEDERSGLRRVRYGDRDRFPFALHIEVAGAAEPQQVLDHLLEVPVDGHPRTFSQAKWRASCPWFVWETVAASGMVFFTADAVVEVRLMRWGPPRDRSWRAAEDALVEALYRGKSCAPASWSPVDLGRALASVGLDVGAVGALGRHLDLHPDDVEVRVLRADVMLRQRNCPGALLEYELATKSDPSRAAGWVGVAAATLQCASSEEALRSALDAATKAVELAPGQAAALEVRADALLGLGLREDAARDLKEAARNATNVEDATRLEDRARNAERGFRVRDRIGD